MAHSGQLAADEAAHAAALLNQLSPAIRKTQPLTVATLPAPALVAAGARGIVTDATVNTYGTVVVGGGAVVVPVFCDGAAWRIG
jgi:hypothetical protein